MHPLLRSKLTTVACAALTLWLLVMAVAAGVRRYGLDNDLRVLESNIDDAHRENARLAQEFERMQEPEWLSLLARQRLNYKLPDETVVFVYKSEKSDTILPSNVSPVDARSHWRQWWDWLRGR
jgi:cell division protein FtsB